MEGGGDDVMGMLAVEVRLVGGGSTAITVYSDRSTTLVVCFSLILKLIVHSSRSIEKKRHTTDCRPTGRSTQHCLPDSI